MGLGLFIKLLYYVPLQLKLHIYKKMALKQYAKSEDPHQPMHPHGWVRTLPLLGFKLNVAVVALIKGIFLALNITCM